MPTHRALALIGQSPQIGEIRRHIEKASRNRLPVLLLGETGTGKEVVAGAIHNANPRGQFVPVDCGALVGTLMESELFGHVKGAFSGAVENKKGLVELADGGTAFFDEIGDLPLDMQVKLLRLVQEREFRAVGSLQWKKVDLRIVAATHRDLKREVAAGRFRQDLYYRLNVIAVHLPALRDRREDIPLLIDHFLGADAELSPEMRAMLVSYAWPGNVRELQHCIERITAMQSEGGLRMADLPSALLNHQAAVETRSFPLVVDQAPPDEEFRPVPKSPVISVRESERLTIRSALSAAQGERGKASKMLGIGRTTLYRRMKEYGLK